MPTKTSWPTVAFTCCGRIKVTQSGESQHDYPPVLSKMACWKPWTRKIGSCPMKTSIYRGSSIARFDYQRVKWMKVVWVGGNTWPLLAPSTSNCSGEPLRRPPNSTSSRLHHQATPGASDFTMTSRTSVRKGRRRIPKISQRYSKRDHIPSYLIIICFSKISNRAVISPPPWSTWSTSVLPGDLFECIQFGWPLPAGTNFWQGHMARSMLTHMLSTCTNYMA